MFLRLNAYAFDIYLVFFGLWCFLIGLLIFRSAFLPRILGVLLAISGLGYLAFLSPPLARYLFIPYIAGASALGQIPLFLWLIVFGVWKEQATAASNANESRPVETLAPAHSYDQIDEGNCLSRIWLSRRA